MKPIYRQHVHEALERLLPAALPGYALTPVKLSKEERKTATLFAGSRLYRRDLPEGALFIHFIPHARQERLQAEVGWSARGRFPAALTSTFARQEPPDELAEDEWLVDFGRLYHRRHGKGFLGWDVWQCSVPYDHPRFREIFVEEDRAPVSEEQARARAEAAVRAALADLQDVAVPYLEEWVRRRRR